MLDGKIFRYQRLVEKGSVEVQLAPGVFAQMQQKVIDSVGEKKINDIGRYEITLDPKDRWKYRTSSLRNIALTAPYMHSGTLATLEEVVAFYNQGGVGHDLQSPLIKPLKLDDSEQQTLVEFLRALTGGNVGALVSDAFEAEVGDVGVSRKN